VPGENLTRAEAQERAALLTVDSYDVELDLSGARSTDARRFGSRTTVRFQCARPGASTFLDLIAPEVSGVRLNGADLDPKVVFDGTRVELSDLAADNEVTIVAECAYSRTGEGLHRFVDPVDDKVYLYTQYEPTDSRRVFANFDQPDLKASFVLTVVAPADWHVISNSPPVAPESLPEKGLGRWRFAPTRRLSTYITAVVAGPYHVVEDIYRRDLGDGQTLEVPLSVRCRASLGQYLDAEEIFAVTKQGLDFFQDAFDFPYPWGSYDQAFVPEYNLGAMENPGCVTFTEDLVFRAKVTDASLEGRANVILHEMAHMWFGDLVTPRWWDDLWLKESFADFMGSFALASATRWKAAWVSFANRRKNWAYWQDQLRTTHPIVADITDVQAAKLNFDGITYAKGASVLKQLVAYVGKDDFLQGARQYFVDHAYGNTTLVDLLKALETTSGRDLRAWADSWLRTAGVNRLTPELTTAADGTVASFAIRQDSAPEFPELRPHRVAIGCYDDGEDDALVRGDLIEIDVDGELTEVPQLVGRARPKLVLVNDEDLTYCVTRLDDESLAVVLARLDRLADPLARAVAWSALWNLTRDGLLPARQFIDAVCAFSGSETIIGVVQSLHGQMSHALDHFVADARRAETRKRIAARSRERLFAAPPASDQQLAWARCFAWSASTPDDALLLREVLSGETRIEGLTVDSELRWSMLAALVRLGVAGRPEIDAEQKRDDTAAGRRHALRCRAIEPTAEAKEWAWQAVVESDNVPNNQIDAIVSGFSEASHADLLVPYVDRYFDVIRRVWRERRIESARRIAAGFYPALLADDDLIARTDAWLAAEDVPPALRRLVQEGRDDAERAVRAQRRDSVG
jgi:aminopeptidase N